MLLRSIQYKIDGGRVCLVLIISLPGLTSGASVYDARVTAVVARFSSLDNMTHIFVDSLRN